MVAQNARGNLKSAQNRVDASFRSKKRLNNDEWMLVYLCLAHLAPVSIDMEAEIMDGDLTLVGV